MNNAFDLDLAQRVQELEVKLGILVEAFDIFAKMQIVYDGNKRRNVKLADVIDDVSNKLNSQVAERNSE